MRGGRLLAIGAAIILAVGGMHAATASTIVIVNTDGPYEGFNDTTLVAPVGGNTGTTIGQQRLNVFETAAGIWGALLPGDTILVEARFNPQSCDAVSAVLGSAGPIQVIRDFPNAEYTGTWYHMALANKLAGSDLSPGVNDIGATFNSSIDNNDGCLQGTNWYYGLDGNEGNDIELLPVVLHELAHGLGFSSLVDLTTGIQFGGPGPGARPCLYEYFIYDNQVGLHWNEMGNIQRRNSAAHTGDVVWDGPVTTSYAPFFLGGVPIMQVNAPPAIAGTIEIGEAEFGPSVAEGDITGDVVLVDDGVGTTSDACEPIINGAQIAGNIALIDRGTCTFVSKALEAQAAGAIAVIIADSSGNTSPIALGGIDPTIVIPVVSITQADGALLKSELGNGLNVTLTLDPTHLAGADTNDHPLLYAPAPVELGSSISHWDVSAYPNLLMEPAINYSISSDVDLTYHAFADLGWIDLPPSAVAGGSRAAGFGLLSNYPNPFNPSTTIRYEVSTAQAIQLIVYDVAGRRVRSLFEGPQAPGVHETTWDGRNDRGQAVASGVYYVRLAGVRQSATRKIVLLK